MNIFALWLHGLSWKIRPWGQEGATLFSSWFISGLKRSYFWYAGWGNYAGCECWANQALAGKMLSCPLRACLGCFQERCARIPSAFASSVHRLHLHHRMCCSLLQRHGRGRNNECAATFSQSLRRDGSCQLDFFEPSGFWQVSVGPLSPPISGKQPVHTPGLRPPVSGILCSANHRDLTHRSTGILQLHPPTVSPAKASRRGALLLWGPMQPSALLRPLPTLSGDPWAGRDWKAGQKQAAWARVPPAWPRCSSSLQHGVGVHTQPRAEGLGVFRALQQPAQLWPRMSVGEKGECRKGRRNPHVTPRCKKTSEQE